MKDELTRTGGAAAELAGSLIEILSEQTREFVRSGAAPVFENSAAFIKFSAELHSRLHAALQARLASADPQAVIALCSLLAIDSMIKDIAEAALNATDKAA